MAYFIANRGATIGGGSLGRTEQLPSLKILCVDLCARHLERLSDLGDIPTEVFIDLLRRAKEKATPALVKRLQDVNARLSCQDVDIAFWKQAVEGHILRRTVPAPGPVLVERVNHHKERLKDLLGSIASPSAETGGEGGQDSREWSRGVSKVLQALEETPVSVGLLKATLIGKAVSQFRKAANPEVARTAMELVRRWKEAAGVAAASTTATATTPGGGGSAAGGSSGGGGGEAVQRSPAEEKRRALEEGFRCRTWESLYQYLELLREEKVRTSSKRAREARERELQKRPKLIVGKSKGQGYTEKTQRISRKSGAPSFFAATSSSSSPRAGARGGVPPLSPPRTPKKVASVAARNSGSSSSKRASNGGANGGISSRKKSGDSSPFGSRSTSSSSSKSRTTTGGRGNGGGGGSNSTTKPRKKNDYNSGTMSVADLRRTVLHAQSLSTPMKAKTPRGNSGRGAAAGGGGAAAAAAAVDTRVTPKKSKFWK